MSKIVLTNAKEFKDFANQINITDINELFKKYTIKLHMPEYSIQHYYSNKNDKYSIDTYWMSEIQCRHIIKYDEFINAFKFIITTDNFQLELQINE